MLVPLDLKTSLARKFCISWHLPLCLCFPSSSFCLFASGSCLLHQNKVASALLMVDSVFQEQKHQEKTRSWVVLAHELSPKALKKPTKIIFASTNSTNPSAGIYTHTLQRGCIWEGYIHGCIQGSWLLCTVVESLFLFLLLHQITMASFSLQTFLWHQLYTGTPLITLLVSVTHNPLKNHCILLKNTGFWNGGDDRMVEQVQPSQAAADFTLSLPGLCWTFSFSAQPTCR